MGYAPINPPFYVSANISADALELPVKDYEGFFVVIDNNA